MKIKIDKDVPLPDSYKKWPFPEMEVGDSFWITSSHVKSVRTCAHVYGKKTGKKFTVRKTGNGYRCWRLPDPEPVLADEDLERIANRQTPMLKRRC